MLRLMRVAFVTNVLPLVTPESELTHRVLPSTFSDLSLVPQAVQGLAGWSRCQSGSSHSTTSWLLPFFLYLATRDESMHHVEPYREQNSQATKLPSRAV